MQSMYYDGDIVISGIAGRFPESNNMKHLKENLMNKVDLISEDDRRWTLVHPEIPHRTGKINNLGKFDATFFGIRSEQAHTMDPMSRMLLEHAYEAIVDAGFNPRHLRGTNTGVFIAACVSESEKTWLYEKAQEGNGLGLLGCGRYMLANRISYWLGVTGPSCTVDSACSSSLYALENAYRAIRSGQCNAALVGGCHLCLHPCVSLQFARLGVLSPEGVCKVFDADANGYCRSESVGIIYLQKAKDAKRIYATCVHAKINCDGFKEHGITFPSSTMQAKLLSEFYEECGVPPTMVSFIEAHGTGTKVGDPEELNAIDRVFSPGRITPLKVGSVKSNLGHGEAASGMSSVAKILIAMETGLIPPNLHYNRPRAGVESLEKGRLKVVTELTPWNGGYAGVNSFGFGGANAHILLKSHTKEKINHGAPKDDLPRLVVASGRTAEAVESILKDVERRVVDAEYVRLLHDIHCDRVPEHMYRGYTIVGGSASQNKPIREIQHYPGAKRPIWFVFSGIGSQWPGMGASLLRLPVFAAAIRKCDAALKPRNLNIYDILTNKDKTTFDNILNSFVGIAAVQIGLVDVLNYIGIVPDKIIGHSFGELGCAYADGCFTAEETILAAFARGRALLETDTIHGSMAAVGLGYKNIKNICPPDIEVACHNGPENSTISGPAEAMKAFVAKLQANKIFAREVPCSNIALQSRYVAKVGPTLLTYLKHIIPEPKSRSSKWVSTSVHRSNWSTSLARLSSAEYHTNNLLSPVLFEETALLIPKDAVTIEIAPHGLIQSILRRSLHPEVTNVGLTERGHKDNVEVLLQGLGKLFDIGLQPQLAKLYPDIEFPVSRGTPMISPLIKWEHSADWFVDVYSSHNKLETGERTVEVTLTDEDYEYMAGHVIDGRNLIPATGYLTLVWETLAMMKGKMTTEISVVIEDVKFLRATTIPTEGAVELTIMIQKGTGSFEVIEGGAAIVTGSIRHVTTPSLEQTNLPIPNDDDIVEEMSSKDIYKDLRLRGYNYSGLFRGVKSATLDSTKGTISWVNNWVAFMDNMLQMSILDIDSLELFVPTGIRKLTIDTKVHLETLRTSTSKEKQFTVRRYKTHNAIIAGGVEICGLKASIISRKKPAGQPVLESYQFVAHRDNAKTTLRDFITMSAHIALENNFSVKVKTVEAINEGVVPVLENLVSPHLVEILGDLPLIQANVNIVTTVNPFEGPSSPVNITIEDTKKLDADTAAMIVSGRDFFANTEMLKKLLIALKDEGFLLAFETANPADIYKLAAKYSLNIVLEKRVANETALLLRKHRKLPTATRIIHVASNNFEWVPKLKSALKGIAEATDNYTQRIILVSDKDFESGLLGLVQCLRKEPGGEIIRGYHIQDENAPDFSKDNLLYADQLRLDLGFNVLRTNGTWGTYRHLHLPETVEQPVYHVWANQLIRGDLSSLRWFEGGLESMSGSEKNLVRVAYAPINFRDVMLATGKLSAEFIADTRFHMECPFGFEYSGVDSTGRRVMGIVQARSFSNIVAIDEDLSWPIPDSWTLEDAATVPCVYATSYYALHLYGRMKKGNKVLIHAGTGGVGQAAINLALHEGCEVFTTVGTPEKRRFIRETFPQISDDHIGNSRDTSFEQMIAKQTNGSGVDIVLNSLAEEKLQASVRCLAFGGRFLEIGKFDLAANNPLGMDAFLKGISFYGIMLDKLIASTVPNAKTACRNVMSRGLNEGAIKPLTRKVFPRNDMEGAFRYMASGKHIGKVIIGIHHKNETLDTPIKALPRYYCRAGHSYVILGGLGGFGLELADWLVLRGANNLVLTSRTGVKNGYQAKRIALWKSYGVNVVVAVNKDAHKREDCEDILNTAAKLGPVDAIFNLAVILKDALMENQTEATFEESFKAKAWGTMQLDRVSRKICPKLRHFVVFSSVVAGRGNAGQTNYGMANSIMERICERRVADGLPGLAIQWGAVGDVGLVADMQEEHKELVIGGTLQQRISSCLFEFDRFLKQGAPIVASMVVAEKRAGGDGAQNITNTILNIMGLKDIATVSTQTPLAELGMDSMMAVEIKQSLEHQFELYLTAHDIRNLNFAKILDMSAKESGNKSRGKSANRDNTIQGMKLLLQIFGEKVTVQEACVKLQTNEQAGRDEIFLIPGIEGYGSVFNNLAGRLKSPATCLQLINSKTTSKITIADMAEQLVPHVLKRSKNRRDFLIAAYSYGSVVAIEVARKLEAEGMTGRLVLIDGSPELLMSIKDEYVSGNNDDEFQTNLILGMMDVASPTATPELAVALRKCTKWSEKLDALISALSDKTAHMTQEDMRFVCTAVYHRLTALQKYDLTHLPPLKSSIVLLKPTAPTMKNASADYGLGKLSREKLEIFTVEGNHVSILDNIKVAAAINGEPLMDGEALKPSIIK